MNIYSVGVQDVLDKISRHCPEALTVFLQCINRMDDCGTFHFTRNLVEDEIGISWTRFKNHIRKLSTENLLEWHTIDEGIAVTILGFDDDY